jgi:hypothetical protein
MIAIIKVILSVLWGNVVFLLLLIREQKIGTVVKGIKSLVPSFVYGQCMKRCLQVKLVCNILSMELSIFNIFHIADGAT